MIRGVHTMFYSSEPEATRAFLRDVMGFPATDVGDGWLIFDLPEADLGVHPSEIHGHAPMPSGTPHVSFYCDDVEATAEALRGKGAEIAGGIEDRGYGRVIQVRVPGDFTVEVYEPKYSK